MKAALTPRANQPLKGRLEGSLFRKPAFLIKEMFMRVSFVIKIYRMVTLLILAMPLLAIAKTDPVAKRPVASVLADFAQKRKFIEPLIKTRDSIKSLPGVTLLHQNGYEDAYKLTDSKGGEYEYVFSGQNLSLYSIHLLNASGPGFFAEFSDKGLIRFVPTEKKSKQITGYMMAWWPDTLEPWYYYELKVNTAKKPPLKAHREIRWDRTGKITCDTYSEAGDIVIRGERGENRLIHPHGTATPTPVPAKSEKARLTQEALATVRARTSRAERFAKLQAVIDACPGDPDNFFMEFEMACCYFMNHQMDEKSEVDKGIALSIHCIEAYPQHANNWKMLMLINYLTENLLYKNDYERAKKYIRKAIEVDPDSIVIYSPWAPEVDYSKELTEQEKKAGLTKESPHYKARMQRREGNINSVRQAAMMHLIQAEKASGGLVAIKALLNERKNDRLFQETIQYVLNRETK